MSVQPLLTPLHMGDLDLPNRIVTAPLTTCAKLSGSRPALHLPKSIGKPSTRRDRATIPTIRLSVGQRPSEVKL
jgi:hypothetical protein